MACCLEDGVKENLKEENDNCEKIFRGVEKCLGAMEKKFSCQICELKIDMKDMKKDLKKRDDDIQGLKKEMRKERIANYDKEEELREEMKKKEDELREEMKKKEEEIREEVKEEVEGLKEEIKKLKEDNLELENCVVELEEEMKEEMRARIGEKNEEIKILNDRVEALEESVGVLRWNKNILLFENSKLNEDKQVLKINYRKLWYHKSLNKKDEDEDENLKKDEN